MTLAQPALAAVVTRTTAAVWHGGSDVRLEELPVPAPRHGELIVRVDLATVCGSDRHTLAGRRAAPCPGVLGHEAVGTVVAAGEGAPASPGERIVWGVTVGCHACDRCRSGRAAKCRKLRKVGHEPVDGPWPLSGAYARHILLPAGATVVRVPATLCDGVAAPAGCATATVMAVLEAAGDLMGLRVLVSGAGMLGLTAAAAVRSRGASEVVVVDPDASRRSLASAFGATALAAPGSHTGEVDVAMEFSGATPAATSALAALTIGGRLVLAGAVAPAEPLAIDAERVVRRWLTITGVHNYEPRHLAEAVAFLDETRTRFPWERLVAPAMGLEHLAVLLTQPSPVAPRQAIAP
ncbi:zinc-binding dehydrogenase [Microbacterium sp. NPDC055683]